MSTEEDINKCANRDVHCELREELVDRNNRLSRINEELEQFISIMSHDLRAPLSNITGFADVLKESCWEKFDNKEKSCFIFITESATRLGELMDDLMEYSRASIDLPREEVFLDIICSEVFQRLSFQINVSGTDIKIDPLPMVRCNSVQMSQVFQNLIDNAIKYRSKDRRSVIHIGCYESEGKYCFYVEDNGIGIPENYKKNQDNVFGAFKRVIEYSEYVGNGIGLAICKRIVENHGGKMWFDSEAGKGTTFYFTMAKVESPTKAKN